MDNKIFSHLMIRLLKAAILILLIIAPVVIVMAVLRPMAEKKARQEILNRYALPEDFKRADFDVVLTHMKEDGEFFYYFENLRPDRLALAQEAAYTLIDQHRRKEDLIKAVIRQKLKVQLLAKTFNYLSYPKEFYQEPQQYPQLKSAVDSFLFEEYVLAMAGACYKGTFDPQFVFRWDEVTAHAAERFRDVVRQLRAAQPSSL